MCLPMLNQVRGDNYCEPIDSNRNIYKAPFQQSLLMASYIPNVILKNRCILKKIKQLAPYEIF